MTIQDGGLAKCEHMVTVNRRRFIIVLQWISPSNLLQCGFYSGCCLFTTKIDFFNSCCSSVPCQGPWRLFKFAISLNIAWILQWSSLVRTLHHSMFYSLHGLRWSQKTSLLQMYGSKLQLRWYCTTVLMQRPWIWILLMPFSFGLFAMLKLQLQQPWSNLH